MTNELKLYQITDQFKELEELADVDDLPAEVVRDTLDSLTGEFHEKAVAVAMFEGNLRSAATTIRQAAEAMLARADRIDKRAESIKAYILYNMQTAGIKKIESPYFTLSIHKNPEKLEMDMNAILPTRFYVEQPPPPPKLDKVALKAALKAGEQIEGAWISQGEHLRIKA